MHATPGVGGITQNLYLFQKTRTKMTQTTITTTPTQDQSQPAKDSNRCTFRYANHGRCRRPAQNPQSGLCSQHASAAEPHDTDNLCMDLFGAATLTELPKLHTPEEISDFLTRVIVLFAEGRITSRRATVFTYASSLLMRGSIFMEQHAEPEVIYDVLSNRTDNQQSTQPAEPSPVLTGATR
jgi:hypothetical protein